MTGSDRAIVGQPVALGPQRACTKLARGALRAASGVIPYKNLDSAGWQ
jgi:hypothetical protein